MSLEARIAAHVHAWEQTHKSGKPRPPETLPFITISREFGCDAADVAQHLVKLLNERFKPVHPWVAYDKELLDKVASELHLRRDLLDALDERSRDEMSELFDTILNHKMDDALVFRKLAEVIRSLAVHGHSVLIGRGSYLITQDLKTGTHVRLVAPRDFRIHAFAHRSDLSPQEAAKQVAEGEKRAGTLSPHRLYPRSNALALPRSDHRPLEVQHGPDSRDHLPGIAPAVRRPSHQRLGGC